jgi:hypothetical protein
MPDTPFLGGAMESEVSCSRGVPQQQQRWSSHSRHHLQCGQRQILTTPLSKTVRPFDEVKPLPAIFVPFSCRIYQYFEVFSTHFPHCFVRFLTDSRKKVLGGPQTVIWEVHSILIRSGFPLTAWNKTSRARQPSTAYSAHSVRRRRPRTR